MKIFAQKKNSKSSSQKAGAGMPRLLDSMEIKQAAGGVSIGVSTGGSTIRRK